MNSDNLSFNVPILFLVFNRPIETRISLEAIRSAKPRNLFIACDGPREGNFTDSARIQEVKSIVANIDWDCDCQYLYQQENLGCGRGPATAIDWFFSEVDAGIIIEDDCIATPSFFEFCKDMLSKYSDTERIMAIAGTNVTKNIHYDTDYIYTNFPIMWGWATWRRAWKKYDFLMSNWPIIRNKKSITDNSSEFWKRHPVFTEFFNKTYENASSGKADVWDHQWIFCNWINKGLTVTPTKNLVKNIGFGTDATHTVIDDLGRANFETKVMLPPYHGPSIINADKNADLYIAKHWFTATWTYFAKILILRVRLLNKLWSWIKPIIRK